VPAFYTDDEQAAWALAESLAEQARSMMREAEAALETWKIGKEMNRLRCARRGISESDAEIRWAESSNSKNALTNNSFHVGLATMYFGAAAANYSRALYLRIRSG
jgi:ADP-ribosylglycohydrolase